MTSIKFKIHSLWHSVHCMSKFYPQTSVRMSKVIWCKVLQFGGGHTHTQED